MKLLAIQEDFRTLSSVNHFCFLNEQFERWGGHLGEIVTGFAHKPLSDATTLHNVMTSVIQEAYCQDIGYFISHLCT